jgi:predicted DCC family thiol-disulfide oxidoreductase YuxK
MNRDKPIILFDGVCNLCTWSVRFVLERDPAGRFQFASIQSPKGGDLYRSCGHLPEAIETFVLIEGGRCYTKSDAAIRVARGLSGFWRWLWILIVVPRPVRNWGYDLIAGNRYRLFGRTDQCMIPDRDVSDRFIDA